MTDGDGAKEEVVCNRCGDCCRTLHIRIPVAKGVNLRAVQANMMLYWNLHEGVHAAFQQVKEDGEEEKTNIILTIQSPCSMLVDHPDGTSTCKIYPLRPPICRSWPTELDRFRHSDIPRCSMLLDPVTGKREDQPVEPVAWLEKQKEQGSGV